MQQKVKDVKDKKYSLMDLNLLWMMYAVHDRCGQTLCDMGHYPAGNMSWKKVTKSQAHSQKMLQNLKKY